MKIERRCCDLCGMRLDKGFFYQTDHGEECPICGWEQNDYALLHPDEMGVKDCFSGLNFERFKRLWLSSMIRKKGFTPAGKAYDIWREAHPELGKRFDMCDFQEVPGIEKRIEKFWNVIDE